MVGRDSAGWIKASDALPNHDSWVMVVHQTNYQNAPPHQSVSVAFYRAGEWYASGYAVHTPTYWQPFPPPPALV